MSELTVTARAAAGSGLDVVYVLTLLQVAFLVLAGLGEVVLMGGNPAYLLLPIVKAVLLILFATQALRRRRWALRAIAVTFWLLAAYIAVESVSQLAAGAEGGQSTVGIILNAVALAVMVPVAVAQLRTGRQLDNQVLVAQAKETWLSNALSINVLVGLGVNALFGWAWADPAVALIVAGFAVYAGVDAWREAGEEHGDR